jgi:hemerythrin-like metal-binding protein
MGQSWEDYLPTRWEPIDREHAEIVRCLRELLAGVNAEDARRARAAVEELVRVAAAHFAHEERLMRENRYPQLSRHKEAHDLYLADAAQYATQVARRGLTPEFRRWATGRLLEWFRFHVSANDVALGAFLWGLEGTNGLEGRASAAPDAAKPG